MGLLLQGPLAQPLLRRALFHQGVSQLTPAHNPSPPAALKYRPSWFMTFGLVLQAVRATHENKQTFGIYVGSARGHGCYHRFAELSHIGTIA